VRAGEPGDLRLLGGELLVAVGDVLARGLTDRHKLAAGAVAEPLGADRGEVVGILGDLVVHHDPTTGVVVLEHASAGRVVATGVPYGNRYISVLTIVVRKITHWRDYLDPVAVFDALGWPDPSVG
jgi:ketosteroid isomerase-like protein